MGAAATTAASRRWASPRAAAARRGRPPARSARLCFSQSWDQRAWVIDWWYRLLPWIAGVTAGPQKGENGKNKDGEPLFAAWFTTPFHSVFLDLYNLLYINGIKRIPRAFLRRLSAWLLSAVLANWAAGDGTRHGQPPRKDGTFGVRTLDGVEIENGNLILCTCAFGKAELEEVCTIIKDTYGNVGTTFNPEVKSTPSKQPDGAGGFKLYHYIVFSPEDSAKMFAHLKPHLHPYYCFKTGVEPKDMAKTRPADVEGGEAKVWYEEDPTEEELAALVEKEMWKYA